MAFAAGQRKANVRVSAMDDTLDDGGETQVTVMPRVGAPVSFGSATAPITEGGSSAGTVTLYEVPTMGVTLVVPITGTRRSLQPSSPA